MDAHDEGPDLPLGLIMAVLENSGSAFPPPAIRPPAIEQLPVAEQTQVLEEPPDEEQTQGTQGKRHSAIQLPPDEEPPASAIQQPQVAGLAGPLFDIDGNIMDGTMMAPSLMLPITTI